MSGWYTTYSGYDTWTPDKGYSDLFKTYVREIRDWFKLKKVPGLNGTEVATGFWKPYVVQGKAVMVIVDRFIWNKYNSGSGPYFRLKIRVARKANVLRSMLSSRTSPMEVFFDEEIIMLFPNGGGSTFPNCPPLFKIDNPGYVGVSDQHGHHLYSSGTLCIMSDSGDWNPDKDTILRALNCCIDWIVWHESVHGSDPRAWRHSSGGY